MSCIVGFFGWTTTSFLLSISFPSFIKSILSNCKNNKISLEYYTNVSLCFRKRETKIFFAVDDDIADIRQYIMLTFQIISLPTFVSAPVPDRAARHSTFYFLKIKIKRLHNESNASNHPLRYPSSRFFSHAHDVVSNWI
jgi:hypothetical protein